MNLKESFESADKNWIYSNEVLSNGSVTVYISSEYLVINQTYGDVITTMEYLIEDIIDLVFFPTMLELETKSGVYLEVETWRKQ